MGNSDFTIRKAIFLFPWTAGEKLVFQKPGNYIAVIANGSRFLREVWDGRVLQYVTFTLLLHNNGLLMENSYGNLQEASRRIRFWCLSWAWFERTALHRVMATNENKAKVWNSRADLSSVCHVLYKWYKAKNSLYEVHCQWATGVQTPAVQIW